MESFWVRSVETTNNRTSTCWCDNPRLCRSFSAWHLIWMSESEDKSITWRWSVSSYGRYIDTLSFEIFPTYFTITRRFARRLNCTKHIDVDDHDSTQKWRLFFYYSKFWKIAKKSFEKKSLTYTSSADTRMYIAASNTASATKWQFFFLQK